jgi:hypothetical protein
VRLLKGLSRRDALAAAGAGLGGSAAYALEMWLDLRLVRYRFNDFTLLGRPFSSNRRVWPALGAALHAVNGALVGVMFALVRGSFPGPGWARGLLFALAENAALWSLMPLIDRYHPGRREGELAPAGSRKSFLVALLRHVAYGLTLGWLYRPRPAR